MRFNVLLVANLEKYACRNNYDLFVLEEAAAVFYVDTLLNSYISAFSSSNRETERERAKKERSL